MFTDTTHAPGVAAALDDLRRDLAKVLPSGWRDALSFHVTLDPAPHAETFRLEILPAPETRSPSAAITIAGADERGAIFGIYEFSHRFLGVDPLWFWKDIEPAPLTLGALLPRLASAPRRIESGSPVFRYRGWFINDEDLLGRWRPPAGARFLDWPKRAATLAKPSDDLEDNYENRLLQYYTPVVAADTMEMIFEAALRLRANLIIPASFIDILNPPEAAIIRAAIRRGLNVSQHHVEPLGVAHFAYETWCAKNGHSDAPFSYREAPHIMRACWRDYAQRWREIAGDRLVWQVGLRGRGDRPLWDHDPEAKARAGEFVASALADQMEIIRSVDPRPAPPATLTLWLEGAELIKSGQLRAPEGVTYVFADDYHTQEMQDDFHTLPREPGRDHGFYYHIAVWTMGPHLVQGPPPEKIARTVRAVAVKGDTAYAILNISNLREHVMGAAVWTAQVWRNDETDTYAFLRDWASPELAPLYREFLECIPALGPSWRFYDGGARTYIDRLVCHHAKGRPLDGPFAAIHAAPESAGRVAIADAIERLTALLGKIHAITPTVDPRLRAFFHFNLRVQATILLGLYRTVAALLASPPDFRSALAALDTVLATLPTAENGRWAHWYRGDTKMGLAVLRRRISRLSLDQNAATHPTLLAK